MAKMLTTTTKNSDPQQHLLQITHHDKFYSRLLSKESCLSNPSFRIYYGGASGAVPFVWESQPGTPKNTPTAATLPPLTPPPSYHFHHKKTKKPTKSNSATSNFIQCILPMLKKRPSATSTTRSSSVSLSSASSSGHRYSSSRSSLSSRADDESSVEGGSPTSTLRGCYSMIFVKNALMSAVVGHGSRHDAVL